MVFTPSFPPSLAVSSSPTRPQGRSSCHHDSNFWLFTENTGQFAFCGLCWLILLWENEVPKRIHAYKQLADNGNPQITSEFRRHLEANMGLVGPAPNQSLKDFRLARGQYYLEPNRRQFPFLNALWRMMGYQPKLARCLIRTLNGQDAVEIAVELGLSPYGVNEGIAKAIRLALRYLRN